MGETRAQSVARDFQAREVRAHAGDWVLSGVGALGLLAVWALLAWVFGWVLRNTARHKGTWTVRNVLVGCVTVVVCGGFVVALAALILGLGVGAAVNVYEWILSGVLVGGLIVGGGVIWAQMLREPIAAVGGTRHWISVVGIVVWTVLATVGAMWVSVKGQLPELMSVVWLLLVSAPVVVGVCRWVGALGKNDGLQ